MQGLTQEVVICDSQWGFKFWWLNTLLSWALSRQDKKIKIGGIINGSVTFKYYEVALTLWTLNYFDCVPFL